MTTENIVKHKKFAETVPIVHDIAIPVQHWQLRDLLHVDENDNLIFSSGFSVKRYDVGSKKVVNVFETTFVINTMSILGGIIVVGGNEGKLAIYYNNVSREMKIGGSINNFVKLVKIKDRVRILTCNNDNILRIIDLNQEKVVESLHHSIPINSCDVSPRDNILTAVCDNHHVFTYYSDGSKYSQYEVRQAVGDAAFTVSYDKTGGRFAIGTQDGFICLYDVRYAEKLACIKTVSESPVKGAVRKVLFTKDFFTDLLLYTTHVDKFGLIDVRENVCKATEFSNRQWFSAINNGQENSITGSCFSLDCGYLYIATNENILQYKISTNNRLMFEVANHK